MTFTLAGRGESVKGLKRGSRGSGLCLRPNRLQVAVVGWEGFGWRLKVCFWRLLKEAWVSFHECRLPE